MDAPAHVRHAKMARYMKLVAMLAMFSISRVARGEMAGIQVMGSTHQLSTELSVATLRLLLAGALRCVCPRGGWRPVFVEFSPRPG